MHALMGQINNSSKLTNCEIAQLQQTTEISYITQILYKLLIPDVWYIWCTVNIAKCWHKVWPPIMPLIYDLITKVNTSHMATRASIATRIAYIRMHSA